MEISKITRSKDKASKLGSATQNLTIMKAPTKMILNLDMVQELGSIRASKLETSPEGSWKAKEPNNGLSLGRRRTSVSSTPVYLKMIIQMTRMVRWNILMELFIEVTSFTALCMEKARKPWLIKIIIKVTLSMI